jgi:hypothetical protein
VQQTYGLDLLRKMRRSPAQEMSRLRLLDACVAQILSDVRAPDRRERNHYDSASRAGLSKLNNISEPRRQRKHSVSRMIRKLRSSKMTRTLKANALAFLTCAQRGGRE